MRGELLLALAPTAVVLGVFALVDVLTRQRLLFASLASSAFLAYLDPEHGTNAVRTLVVAHLLAATAGLVAYLLLGPSYTAAGGAVIVTIVAMTRGVGRGRRPSTARVATRARAAAPKSEVSPLGFDGQASPAFARTVGRATRPPASRPVNHAA